MRQPKAGSCENPPTQRNFVRANGGQLAFRSSKGHMVRFMRIPWVAEGSCHLWSMNLRRWTRRQRKLTRLFARMDLARLNVLLWPQFIPIHRKTCWILLVIKSAKETCSGWRWQEEKSGTPRSSRGRFETRASRSDPSTLNMFVSGDSCVTNYASRRMNPNSMGPLPKHCPRRHSQGLLVKMRSPADWRLVTRSRQDVHHSSPTTIFIMMTFEGP